MRREWEPGQSVPKRYSGMPVTFAWNEAALTVMLRALEVRYPAGYRSMCDHVREAMRTFTTPTLSEPTGRYAEVESGEGTTYYRSPAGTWHRATDNLERPWDHIGAVEVLSAGVTS